MDSDDLDRTASRLIGALHRIEKGLRLQRDRILLEIERAPRLLEGTPEEATNYTGLLENDLDYYTYELARLQDVARRTVKIFERPSDVVAALEAFDTAIPGLRDARNPLTHPHDRRMDTLGSFSALVRLRDDGGVDYLVDPRYGHHDAAENLVTVLFAFLRNHIRST